MKTARGAKLRKDLALGWNVVRFFARRIIEFVASVWVPGIAPFLARLYFTAQRREAGYEWIPADLYLFAMVSGAAVAFEAFNDRRSDGPFRTVAGLTGFLALAIGAAAYGLLESEGAHADRTLRYGVRWVLVGILSTHLCYKLPLMWTGARQEARRKKGYVND